MRSFQERLTRSALALLLLLLPVTYLLTQHSTYRRGQEAVSLVVSSREVQKMISSQNVSLPSFLPTTSSEPDDLDFVVIKNKVIPKSNIWPPMLKLSGAADLYRLDFSKFTPEDQQFLVTRRNEMVARAKVVMRVCKKAHRSFKPINSKFVFDQNHSPNIAWCPNFKVASTTWMINFLKLAHFNDDNPAIPDLPPEEKNKLKYSVEFGARHPAVYQLYPVPDSKILKLKILKKSVRVIIVRHPFTRVLSAYRDKMVKEKPLPSMFKFGDMQKEIIAKYRPESTTITSPFPTFQEFVQYVIDSTATLVSAHEWRKKVRCWTPYWVQCGVCNNDFNIIIKLETMAEDERFLITLASLTELQKSAGEWRHLNNVSSTQVAPEYFRQLTRRQMLDLHQRYKLDFDLFGYTVDEYLPLANDAVHTRDMGIAEPTVHK